MYVCIFSISHSTTLDDVSQGTAEFVHDVRKLLVLYGVVISSHFLVGLVVLCILYRKVLMWIRNLKNSYSMHPDIQCI